MVRNAVAIALAFILVFGIWAFLETRPAVEPVPSFPVAMNEQRIKEIQKQTKRTIVDAKEYPTGTVSYSYLADPVPETLAEKEVPELRTENSYTKFIAVVKEAEDPIVKLETIFYSQPQFARDADGTWRHVEYATTTAEALQTPWSRLFSLIIPTVFALNISPFSELGDGYVTGYGSGLGATQAACRSSAVSDRAGDGANVALATFVVYTELIVTPDEPTGWFCDAYTYRGFLPFITSAMPGGSSVSAATLNVYATAKTNLTNDGTDYITVTQTSQATHTALVAADWDNVSGEGIDSGERKDITSISTGAYLVFTLNATGRGWIKGSGQSSNCSATAGITCLGLLEGHDHAGSTAEVASNSVTFSSADQTGTTQDPYLSVTYTAPVSALPFGPSFSVGSSGRFEVGADGRFEISPF